MHQCQIPQQYSKAKDLDLLNKASCVTKLEIECKGLELVASFNVV